MKNFSGVKSHCLFSGLLMFMLLFVSMAQLHAQAFAPNNVYNGWNSSVFATIPTVSGLTFSQMARASGLSSQTAGDGYNSAGFDVGTASAAQATANGDYVVFSITANASTSFTVTSVSMGLRRSGTGPTGYQLEYSVNNAPFAVFGAPWSTSSSNTSNFFQTLTSTVAVPIGGNLVFRVIGYGSSNAGGTLRILNGTAINGNAGGTPNTLATTGVSPSSYCVSPSSGAAVNVAYTATGTFTSGNVYTAQLSDASGNFSAPVAIGTLSSTALSGTINATIPAGTAAGTGYRIRVVANGPSTTGTDNGSNLSVLAGVAFTHTTTDLDCNGDNTGAITTTVTSGVSPFTYAWSTGATTASINNLAGGTYSLTVTGSNGCTAVVASAVVNEPSPLTGSSVVTGVLCNGNADGEVALTVNGGTTPYNYAWSNSATSQNVSGLGAGVYSVIVTDANGCTLHDTMEVNEPDAIDLLATVTDALCNAAADGAISLSVSGGTTPYNFMWSNSATSQNISGLTAGSYAVTVTDNAGCTQSDIFPVNEPTFIAASSVPADVLCNAGSTGAVSLSVNGGTGPYTFAWSNTANTQHLSGVPAGVYSVVITDANGCTQHDTVTVSEPAAIAAASVATDALCNGSNDGAVTLTVNGGISPYNFAWSNAANTQNLSAVGAGVYSVTITDANGCVQHDTVTVNEPAAIVASFVVTDALCSAGQNGAVALSVSGGSAPYTFAWNNSAVTQNISNLASGVYSVIITDATGCVQHDTVTVNDPAAMSTSAVITDASCNGSTDGVISFTILGGTQPYSCAWSNSVNAQSLQGVGAGVYSVIITDANGCMQYDTLTVNEPSAIDITTVTTAVNCHAGSDGAVQLSVNGGAAPYTFSWSNSANTQNLSNLAAGNYSVTVTDNSGCTVTHTVAVTQPSNALNSSITAFNATCGNCANGAANLTVAGGTAPYTYAWSNSSTNEDLLGLLPGTYVVTITDANGCQTMDTVIITFSTGIDAVTAQNSISIFPNPSTGENLIINAPSVAGTLLLAVYDANGQQVYNAMPENNGSDSYRVSLGLPNGCYFYQLSDENGLLQTGRLLIVK